MAQIQFPNFENPADVTQRRLQGVQNAMVTRSALESARLNQARLGMENETAAREERNRAELERLLMQTPEEERARAGLEFLKTRDPDKAAKLQTHYLSRFMAKAQIDPQSAVSELERDTGEKVTLGTRYMEIDTQAGKMILDRMTGQRVPQQLTEQAKSDIQKTREIEVERERQSGRMEDTVYKSMHRPLGAESDVEGIARNRAEEYFRKTGQKATPGQIADWMEKARLAGAVYAGNRPMTPYQNVQTEMGLKRQFEAAPIVKEYDVIRNQMGRIESAVKASETSQNFVAIDQALIQSFNKMNDPNSVVKEGEYARTIANSPLLSRIMGKADQISKGGAGLTKDERDAILGLSRDFYRDTEELYGLHASEHERLATEYGLSPNRVVVKRAKVAPKTGADAAGARIVQRNKKTGEVRHSTDGRKTWQPGP